MEKTEAEKFKDRLQAAGLEVDATVYGASGKPHVYQERYHTTVGEWTLRWKHIYLCSYEPVLDRGKARTKCASYDVAAELMIALARSKGLIDG